MWNLVQKPGERISEEGGHCVKEMEEGWAERTEEIPVLFEEMDGVWLSRQDSVHKKMKVFTMYEGWDVESKGSSRLVKKEMLAGMEKQ